MNQVFTNNDLIRYIYKETSSSEQMAISRSINEDWNMSEKYTELYRAYKEMPKATFSPSTNCIQNILKYSKETAVETQF